MDGREISDHRAGWFLRPKKSLSFSWVGRPLQDEATAHKKVTILWDRIPLIYKSYQNQKNDFSEILVFLELQT